MVGHDHDGGLITWEKYRKTVMHIEQDKDENGEVRKYFESWNVRIQEN